MQSPVTFQIGEPPVSHNPSNGLTSCLLCISPGKFPIVKRKLKKEKKKKKEKRKRKKKEREVILKDLPQHL